MSDYIESASATVTPFIGRLQETPAFMLKAVADNGRQIWPTLRILCARGHNLGAFRLVNTTNAGWDWETVQNTESAVTFPDGNVTRNSVSFLRTTFYCSQCDRKNGKTSNIPVRGERLLMLYSAAIVQDQRALKLD